MPTDEALMNMIEDAFEQMRERMDFSERELVAIQRTVTELAQGKRPSDMPAETTASDRLWLCKCGTRLGVYDPDDDVLRIRVRDQYIYFHSGTGGWTKITCRNCGYLNSATEE